MPKMMFLLFQDNDFDPEPSSVWNSGIDVSSSHYFILFILNKYTGRKFEQNAHLIRLIVARMKKKIL
jgi:hypothetical protein